jgi:transcriptional regulator with XRE-family HTH domain
MKYLKYWRLVKGKSQQDVAGECGISQGHYCDIEKRGIKPRTPDLYGKLAESLGRPKEELVAKLHGVDRDEMDAHGATAK